MEPDDLLCSRNARSGTPLVGRAQWKINQPPSLEKLRASVEGSFIASFDGRTSTNMGALPGESKQASLDESIGSIVLARCAQSRAVSTATFSRCVEQGGNRFDGCPHHINVSAICPGSVSDDLVDASSENILRSEKIDPFDVAEAAVYLATLGKYTVVHQIVIGRRGVDW
jgi:hypothetical protein